LISNSFNLNLIEFLIMILAALIGTVEDSNIHCEMINDPRYEKIRSDVK